MAAIRRKVPSSLGLLTVVAVSGCILDPELKVQSDTHPVDIGDGWTISAPAAEGFDEAALGDAFAWFYADTAYFNAVSLLIARNGKLIAEAYARSARDRGVKRNVQSVTKSVTSLVFGIARGDGLFPDLDQTLYSILPDAFDQEVEKRQITLRHLLTMRSGILFDNDDFTTEIVRNRPHDQARYILSKALYNSPGAEFYYRDADPQLLSSAVERVTGRTLEAIATERLFGPLGITDYFWEANVDGTSFGPFGLFLRPRDLLKIGQLALQDGEWEGQQIVPQEWIVQSTAAQTQTPQVNADYGYYWWVVPELDAFTASGHGGQFVFVVPADALVIVMTSLPSSDGDVVGTTLDRFLPLVRKILGAIAA